MIERRRETNLARDIDAIVIGASAGGITALLTICGALPSGFVPAVLVVLHLPPDRRSTLAPLLADRCALPVMEALDKLPVTGGTVVVAPPDYHLLVEPDRRLALSCDPPVLFSRPAIDPLFESAARVWESRLLAILLTGASTDGTSGVSAVRRHGGLAWIQDPGDAWAPVMPASAVRHAGADAILTLQEISRRLAGNGV